MNSYDFTVSTEPLARQMDGVTTSVGVVGGAVTAMQAAVIASEVEAANTICNSIDSGFFMLLRSRFSERLSRLQSAMSARVGSMMETSSAIDRTHRQMEGDFQRIKARYLKTFDRLDRSLEERVRELDTEAMRMAEQRNAVMASWCVLAPEVMYCSSEVSQVALKATGARVKSRAFSSVESLCEGARHLVDYKRVTKGVMDTQAPACSCLEFVPVVFASKESMATPGQFSLDVQPPEELPADAKAAIAQEVVDQSGELLSADAQEMARVRDAFDQKVQQAELDPRVRETMVGLFNASVYGAQGGRA
ncbi:MAG: hypothetical protein Q4B54_05250 [Coriobacteriales bacterium]|nr:hypothetical protein [Coriobacteriales bacterium]